VSQWNEAGGTTAWGSAYQRMHSPPGGGCQRGLGPYQAGLETFRGSLEGGLVFLLRDSPNPHIQGRRHATWPQQLQLGSEPPLSRQIPGWRRAARFKRAPS